MPSVKIDVMEPIDPWAPADPLAEALHFLRMSGAYYCRSELSAPWGLTLMPMPGYMWFHTSPRAGSCSRAEAPPTHVLRPGDFALVPHGEGHALRSDAGVRRRGSSSSSVSLSATATRSSATAAAGRRRR